MRAFVTKGLKFVWGLCLYLYYRRTLNLHKLFKGKRIAIVGAANSAYNGKGDYIDEFDIVIRINKAPFLLKEGIHSKDIGQKADVLFHNFFENETFGGGPLDFHLYDDLGIKYVVNPISTSFGRRNTFNFYKKYCVGRVVYELPRKDYERLTAMLKGFRPTVGFCVLFYALEAAFSELYITGFTFFRTKYADGYRSTFEDVTKLRDTMEKMQIHNPDIEFEAFMNILSKRQDQNVFLDEILMAMVRAERKTGNHGDVIKH